MTESELEGVVLADGAASLTSDLSQFVAVALAEVMRASLLRHDRNRIPYNRPRKSTNVMSSAPRGLVLWYHCDVLAAGVEYSSYSFEVQITTVTPLHSGRMALKSDQRGGAGRNRLNRWL